MNRTPTVREPILLVGGYGYENAGDEAILSGLLSRLAGRRVTVLSRSPRRTTELHGVPAVGLTRAVAELRSHRTVFIGGGGLFGRDMGRIGRLLPWYGLLAWALGRSVVLDGIGLDAGTPPSVRLPLVWLMRRARRIVVRDEASAALVRSWGLQASVESDRSTDMAPARPEAGAQLLRGAGVDLTRPVVGLALTAVDQEMARAVEDAAVETMAALPDVQFCFIPMSRHPFVAQHNDLHLARRLQRRRPELRVIEAPAHPSELLAAFDHLSAAICMRYHGLLFAERAGIPILPIVYAPKVAAWAAERRMRPVTPSAAEWTARLAAVVGRSAVSPVAVAS